jgi:hypothetical protein
VSDGSERINRSPSNLSKAGWSLGRVSTIDSNGRTIWIADAHRNDGKPFVVRAHELLTALELRSMPPGACRPASSQALPRRPPMLNSARRHCTSPRRGRQVEWSDQRPGNVRLHLRSRRSCRRCASDASQESVGAGSIDVTTTENPLRIDSVKRCKG